MSALFRANSFQSHVHVLTHCNVVVRSWSLAVKQGRNGLGMGNVHIWDLGSREPALSRSMCMLQLALHSLQSAPLLDAARAFNPNQLHHTVMCVVLNQVLTRSVRTACGCVYEFKLND